MKKKFRVIDTGCLSAARNMALDEAMLEARHEGSSPDTIRFLSFYPHAALVGQFQAVEKELRPGYCRDMGIDINRRITGGGALYWNTPDVGWEIFSTRDGGLLPALLQCCLCRHKPLRHRLCLQAQE